MSVVTNIQPTLSNRQRDYLLITVFVLGQNGDHARAKQIIDGMLALGERSEKVLTAQAVLEFLCGNYVVALRCLDQLEQMAGNDSNVPDQDTKRMRQYLRARCYYSSGREKEARDIAAMLSANPANLRAM